MNDLPRATPALLHPFTLLALALWTINDHLLKGWGPAVLTGKLSDVAALVVCPIVLFGIVEWCAPSVVQRKPRTILGACTAAIGLLLIGLELCEPVELVYQHALSSAQHAARALGALLSGRRVPDYALVQTTPDVSDLLTLPMLAVPWWLVLRRSGRPRDERVAGLRAEGHASR